MQRTPEPELMLEPEQAQAYAQADFEQAHQSFVDQFIARFPDHQPETVIDFGCGPADISIRFARAYPQSHIIGIDGSAVMLEYGRKAISDAGLQEQIELKCNLLPVNRGDLVRADTIICNSLLHHLHEPGVLWDAIKDSSAPSAVVMVMDLRRPGCEEDVSQLVEEYAANEPEILRRDFRNSLCAAFTKDEVRGQLHSAGLSHLKLENISDRHLLVAGTI